MTPPGRPQEAAEEADPRARRRGAAGRPRRERPDHLAERRVLVVPVMEGHRRGGHVDARVGAAAGGRRGHLEADRGSPAKRVRATAIIPSAGSTPISSAPSAGEERLEQAPRPATEVDDPARRHAARADRIDNRPVDPPEEVLPRAAVVGCRPLVEALDVAMVPSRHLRRSSDHNPRGDSRERPYFRCFCDESPGTSSSRRARSTCAAVSRSPTPPALTLAWW